MGAFHFLQDVFSFLGPDEGFRGRAVMRDVVLDRLKTFFERPLEKG